MVTLKHTLARCCHQLRGRTDICLEDHSSAADYVVKQVLISLQPHKIKQTYILEPAADGEV